MRHRGACKGPGLLAVLAAWPVLAYALLANPSAPWADAAAIAHEDDRHWIVTVPGNGDPWIIAHGSGVDFPQVAALHPKSGYFRLVRKTTFGTSIVLPPVFWSGGGLARGMPLGGMHHAEGERVIFDTPRKKKSPTGGVNGALSPPGGGG